MGTRADFWIWGEQPEWLGSVGWDGYEWAEEPTHPIHRVMDEATYRQVVAGILADRDDATLPEQGWPWPWETSETTDYAYWLEPQTGRVRWTDPPGEWPDMSAGPRRDLHGPHSGFIVIGVPSDD